MVTGVEEVERRFFEAQNQHSTDAIDKVLAANLVDHTPIPGFAADRNGLKEFFRMSFAAFPDLHNSNEDMIISGDKVAVRFASRGTHKGPFMGIPATGKRITITGMATNRMAGGQIVENWVSLDLFGLLQQLGAIPPMGPAPK